MAIVVANRYARALVDVVAKTGEYEQVLRELEDFATVCRESADLREVLRSPAVTLEAKGRLLQAILERLGASQVTTNFLRVLLDHYRIALLEEVLAAYQRLAYDQLGIVEVKIASAGELSAAEREVLRARFAELTRKQVELEFEREPELLGGVVAQIRSTVYDGSVRGHLRRIKEQLLVH